MTIPMVAFSDIFNAANEVTSCHLFDYYLMTHAHVRLNLLNIVGFQVMLARCSEVVPPSSVLASSSKARSY